MLRRFLLITVSAAMLAGCVWQSSSDDTTTSPTPQCTPAPAFNVTFHLDGTNAQAHDGTVAMLRTRTGASVVYCSSAAVGASGAFQFSGGPDQVVGYTMELVLNSGNEASFGPGDEHYSFTMFQDGTTSGNDCVPNQTWTVPFDYATAVQKAVTWPAGQGCP